MGIPIDLFLIFFTNQLKSSFISFFSHSLAICLCMIHPAEYLCLIEFGIEMTENYKAP
jgi:hypothetical protein